MPGMGSLTATVCLLLEACPESHNSVNTTRTFHAFQLLWVRISRISRCTFCTFVFLGKSTVFTKYIVPTHITIEHFVLCTFEVVIVLLALVILISTNAEQHWYAAYTKFHQCCTTGVHTDHIYPTINQ